VKSWWACRSVPSAAAKTAMLESSFWPHPPLSATLKQYSIERLTVEPSCEHHGRQSEKRERPEFRQDFGEAISLEQQAAHDSYRMRRGEDFAHPLRPDGHPLERKDEARQENLRQERKLGELDRLHLVC
jgi:hypothetical protein